MSLRTSLEEGEKAPIRKYFSSVPGAHILYVCPPACCRCRWFSHEVFGGTEKISLLFLDDTDIALGNFGPQIIDSLKRMLPHFPERPKAIQVCVTCAFEIVGVDYDDLLLELQEAFPDICFLVFPIHHLSSHGPIMAPENRELSLYKALKEPLPTDEHAVNIVDGTIDLDDSNELWLALQACGIERVRQPVRMETFEEYQKVAASCLNIQIGRMGGPACAYMEKALGIPSLRVPETYSPRRVQEGMRTVCDYFGIDTPNISDRIERCDRLAQRAREAFKGHPLIVSESSSSDSLDMALALHEFGFEIEALNTIFPRENKSEDLVRLMKVYPNLRVFNTREESHLRFSKGAVILGWPSPDIDTQHLNYKAHTHGMPYGIKRIERFLFGLAKFGERWL